MAKHLIIDGAKAKDDWCYVEDDAPLTDTPSIISLARLQKEAQDLRTRNAPLAVVLRATTETKKQAGDDPHLLEPFLDMVQMVAIDFPAYRNGRGYSSARILREQYGFKGELRAIGEVLYDQWQFMARCGINAFEIDETTAPEDFDKALRELPDAYQPAGDKRRGILWQRR